MLISLQQKLADIIYHDFRLIPIISRFGIPFGFGDKSIRQICDENTINPHFFLEIVNAFHDKDYQPDKELQTFSLKLTVNYLLKSHSYYNNEKIPLIERLIEQSEWENKEGQKHKKLITKFFEEYKKEVGEHTRHEELQVYPYVLDVEEAFLTGQASPSLIQKIKNKPIKAYEGEHEELNTALFDLKNIIIKYLPPAKNSEVTEQILTETFRLEKDMKDHTRIEDKVLIPKVAIMESAVLNRIRKDEK